MTPIYASNRLDASGWYAFQQPEGTLAIWDGGANRDGEQSTVGLWNAMTGEPIVRSASYLDRLPKMPMYGWIYKNKFWVTDFPHVEQILNITGRRTDNPVYYMVGADGSPVRFFLATLEAPNVLEDPDVAQFVNCRILPENKDAAREVFRAMGPGTLLRHPMSFWTRQRNPLYASVKQPHKTEARIREITVSGGYVDTVTCWLTPEHLVSFYPMYDGDQYPDKEVFVPTNLINIYSEEGTIIGYD